MCHDCGKDGYSSSRKRRDICDRCWELRGKLLRAVETGKLGLPEFQAVQRRAAFGRRGTAAAAMEAALAKTEVGR